MIEMERESNARKGGRVGRHPACGKKAMFFFCVAEGRVGDTISVPTLSP